jgi:hypothetical protein
MSRNTCKQVTERKIHAITNKLEGRKGGGAREFLWDSVRIIEN